MGVATKGLVVVFIILERGFSVREVILGNETFGFCRVLVFPGVFRLEVDPETLSSFNSDLRLSYQGSTSSSAGSCSRTYPCS